MTAFGLLKFSWSIGGKGVFSFSFFIMSHIGTRVSSSSVSNILAELAVCFPEMDTCGFSLDIDTVFTEGMVTFPGLNRFTTGC